ncbi:FecR family protein [Pedobacter sp. N23S346]|uniref:FecR family protein n=1 Tax=Pedobacter sp. N23S346 TaxID=3402750 RepID=UPI003ACF8721
MDYHSYHAEDFAADESFNAYYLESDQTAVKFWEEWISHHPEKLDEIYNAEQLLAALYLRLPDEELHLEFERFDQFLGSTSSPEQFVKTERDKAPLRFWFAAMAVFLIAVFGGVFFLIKPGVNQPQTYITRKTSSGKMLIVSLSDGTTVTLNANSSIKYPKIFQGNKRSVSLIGEAFFEVSKDSTRQFIVTAGATKTTVYGTKFNIDAYPESKNIEIALFEGSIAVSTSSKSGGIRLQPNQKAVFNRAESSLSLQTINANEEIDWKAGTLIFNNSGFEEIALKIKNTYGITLIDNSHSGQWQYTGTFNKTDYLTIIKNICFARNLTFSQDKQNIILK